MAPSTLLKDQTIGDIVAEDFARADIFSAYGIDFCCGGKKSLSEACAERNLDVNEVAAKIAEMEKTIHANKPDFSSWTPSLLIHYLLDQHHAWIRTETPLILQYGEKVAQTHGHAAPEAVKAVQIFSALSELLEDHLQKEELILFPAIIKMDNDHTPTPSGLEKPISEMEEEHESVGVLMHQLEALTQNFAVPEWGCNTFKVFYGKLRDFRDKLYEHVHIENNILFPRYLATNK